MDIGQIIKIPKIENVSLLDAQLRVDCKGILMTNPHDFRYVSDKVCISKVIFCLNCHSKKVLIIFELLSK